MRLESGETVTLSAPAVVLATGGIGGLYRYTTNPTASRGTGIAIAARAGARLSDLEFVQFHPTALDVPSDPLPLVSEAVRGEGALLVDAGGERIMAGVDPALELAPRDVVARRVAAVRATGTRVYLDARALASEFAERFPTVYAACARFGIDPRVERIPIVPAEHYHMGGIAVDECGRTNVPGLYACGEVAATGVHGANRLASNSLLESVVYPERIAADVRQMLAVNPSRVPAETRTYAAFVEPPRESIDLIRDAMYENVGVERNGTGLESVRARLRDLARDPDTASEDVRDAATAGALVAHAALMRRESRGGHFRSDYPHDGRGRATLLDDVVRSRFARAVPALMQLARLVYEPLVRAALLDDFGTGGDVTSEATIPPGTQARATLVSRKPGVLAGLDAALFAFELLDAGVVIERYVADGSSLAAGDAIAAIAGDARALLGAERTALNVLSHASGIATATARYVAAIPAGSRCAISETRKTLPGLRALEKYAVRAGGGANHRMRLDDAILIKDNHVAIAGGIAPALAAARARAGHLMKIEIEVDSLEQLDEVLAIGGADCVLLDNFSLADFAEGVRRVAGRTLVEASGGITLESIAAIANTGVDVISIGALTHSAIALDIGLDIAAP